MSKRLEDLKALRDAVEAQGVIRYTYLQDGCYCVIGHYLKICGVSDDNLEKMGGNCILDFDKATNEIGKYVVDLLPQLSINALELNKLQRLNDRGDQDALHDYINKMIRVEELHLLRKAVVEEKVIKHYYKAGDCYCVVGHYLKMNGVDDLTLGLMSSRGIKNTAQMPFSVQNEIDLLLPTLSLSINELEKMQMMNDNPDIEDEVLIAYIDELIELEYLYLAV